MTTESASLPPLMELLSAEHATLLPGVAALGETADRDGGNLASAVADLADKLSGELDQHIEQEEKVLFPALREAMGGSDVVDHFVEEHREIERLRDALLAAHRAGEHGPGQRQVAAQLVELLTAHMTREDAMLFPMARDLLN